MKKEIAKLLNELPFYQVRDLETKEKRKSLDYWEGYTAAIAKLTRYLKDEQKNSAPKQVR